MVVLYVQDYHWAGKSGKRSGIKNMHFKAMKRSENEDAFDARSEIVRKEQETERI